MLPLLPFLFALIIAERGGRLSGPDTPWVTLLTIIAVGSGAWLILSTVMNRIITQRRSHRLLIWWDIIAQGVALGWLAWLCLSMGWATKLPGVVLALMPYLLILGIHWATWAVGVRGVSLQPWTRRGMLLHQIRSSALPLVLGLGCIVDLSEYITVRMLGGVPVALELAGFAVLGFAALTVTPFVIERLWSARPLPPGPRADLLHTACTRMGYADARLRLWPMPYGRHHNAVVIGFLPRLRTVLLSQGLLEDLSDDELVAVIGHELGHTRHRHLLLYLLFLGTVIALGSVLAWAFHGGLLPGARVLAERPWTETGVALLGVVFAWRIGFGWLSRGCERQADLAGAALAGSPQVMAAALKSVARLSGEREDAPNWRHASIGNRAAYMAAVANDPTLAHRHHRTMRFSLVILLVVMVTSLALNLWMNPVARAISDADPAATLATMAERDPTLSEALKAADNGDPTALAKWYQRTDQTARRTVALLTLRTPGTDDAQLYSLRHRLMAFSGIDSGDPQLNASIDNALAYGLVAGTATPTANDLEAARRLLPNLERAVQAKPSAAVVDTIGCVHFRLEHWPQAIDAFQNALSRLADDRSLTAAAKAAQEPLFRRRLEAAIANRDGARLALPLELIGTPAAETP